VWLGGSSSGTSSSSSLSFLLFHQGFHPAPQMSSSCTATCVCACSLSNIMGPWQGARLVCLAHPAGGSVAAGRELFRLVQGPCSEWQKVALWEYSLHRLLPCLAVCSASLPLSGCLPPVGVCVLGSAGCPGRFMSSLCLAPLQVPCDGEELGKEAQLALQEDCAIARAM
jgi:hypothetical protein